MSNISDETRREVAARLRDRDMTRGTDGRAFDSADEYANWLDAQLFWIRTCLLPAAGRTETWTFEQLLDVLADLIDRPATDAGDDE